MLQLLQFYFNVYWVVSTYVFELPSWISWLSLTMHNIMNKLSALKDIENLGTNQGCSLGLDVSVSRRSRDLFFQCLGLVSVSGKCGMILVSVSSWTETQMSRSRLGSRAWRSRSQANFLEFYPYKYITVLFFIINTCFVSRLFKRRATQSTIWHNINNNNYCLQLITHYQLKIKSISSKSKRLPHRAYIEMLVCRQVHILAKLLFFKCATSMCTSKSCGNPCRRSQPYETPHALYTWSAESDLQLRHLRTVTKLTTRGLWLLPSLISDFCLHCPFLRIAYLETCINKFNIHVSRKLENV